ncbi:MAG: hypothetical protein JNL98_44855, partial [Bryobacterales bacterium]|nr:hypothetical protein [Bryobacterales bacterium]
PDLVNELRSRAISERAARKLLRELPAAQPVMEQIRWIDQLIARSPGVKNPPGFYISLLRENVPVPGWFLDQLAAVESSMEQATQQDRQQREELFYARYRRKTLEQWVRQNVPAAEWEELVGERMKAIRKQYPNLVEESQRELVEGFARTVYVERVPMMSLQEFLTSQQLA